MTDSTDEVDWYDGPDEEPFEESPKRRENKQWLRFAEAAMSNISIDVTSYNVNGTLSGPAFNAASFADAMLVEAKKRGRV